jgi:hypothetical protein
VEHDGCRDEQRLLTGRTAGVCLSAGNLELLAYRPLARAHQCARAWSLLMILNQSTDFNKVCHKPTSEQNIRYRYFVFPTTSIPKWRRRKPMMMGWHSSHFNVDRFVTLPNVRSLFYGIFLYNVKITAVKNLKFFFCLLHGDTYEPNHHQTSRCHILKDSIFQTCLCSNVTFLWGVTPCTLVSAYLRSHTVSQLRTVFIATTAATADLNFIPASHSSHVGCCGNE